MIVGILSVLLFAYLILLGTTIIGWNKTDLALKNNNQQFVTVIIPFRNEQNNLQSTIASVLKNNPDFFELLLIDDHSIDQSYNICKSFESKHVNISVLKLDKTTGKKAAIKLGVEHAKAEIILQTDADCIVPHNWIQNMSRSLEVSTNLLIGPVKVKTEEQGWNWLNQVEFCFLQAFTGASANFNQPLMANGANLMYRKSIYWEYQKSQLGKEYASGDDQFLLNYIKRKSAKSINYVKNQGAIVATSFSSKWSEITAQRTRWAKKKSNSNLGETLIGTVLFLAQFLIPTCILLTIFDSNYLMFLWATLLIKVFGELFLVFITMNFFGINRLKYIPIFSFVYPIFLSNIITLAAFRKNKWKGREI